MENALNNLLKTPEAQRLVALMGQDGLEEYLMSIMEKAGGDFDTALRMMGVHQMAVERLKEQGIPLTYDLLAATPPPPPGLMKVYTPPPMPQVPSLPTPAPQAQGQQMAPLPQRSTPQVLGQSESVPQVRRASTPQPQRFSSYQNTPTASPTPTPPGGPNVVAPFEKGAYMTGGMGSYPGHMGEDYGYDPSGSQRAVVNAIGGIPIAGTDQEFGNYYGVIGANPQEYAQMSPQERQNLISSFQRQMTTAGSLKDVNIPGRNVLLQAHLANIPQTLPDYSATGSARLTMGNTGNSTGLHTHQEIKDTRGNLRGLTDFAKQYGSQISYPYGYGGTGGGTKRNPVDSAIASAQKAFSMIVRPVQAQTMARRTSSPTPTPTPYVQKMATPAPKSYSAPKTHSAPKPSPTPAPRSYVAPQKASMPAMYSTPKNYSAPKPSPTPAPQRLNRSPMQSTYKPVTYSRPSPQKNFFQQAQKTFSNFFRRQ